MFICTIALSRFKIITTIHGGWINYQNSSTDVMRKLWSCTNLYTGHCQNGFGLFTLNAVKHICVPSCM